MSMFNKVSKSFMFGQHEVTLTTGEIARQASGAVVVQMGDTVILAGDLLVIAQSKSAASER